MPVLSEHLETLAVHAGAAPDPVTGSRITPIYQTASFAFDSVEKAAALFALEESGYKYSRTANPTVAVLEERVAALEGGTAALALASGQAAVFLALYTLLQPGGRIVSANRTYGGTMVLFEQSFPGFGWGVDYADTEDPDSFERAVTPDTRAVFVESIANPGGVVVDLEAVARVARRHRLPLIVDNTLATPYLVRPFESGADVVVHSATKFLGGHGNSLGGVIVDGGTFNGAGDGRYPLYSAATRSYPQFVIGERYSDKAVVTAARLLGLHDLGPALSPFNAFLILNGIETLALRMERHCANAVAVAAFLDKHPAVAWVSYSGLPSDPHYPLARKYAPLGAGSVFTVGLTGGYDAGVKLVNNLKLFSHLANIGDTRSLVIHPASTTHKQVSDEQKRKAGVGPEAIRLSIGLEHVDDIIADLAQALEA
ncbi:MAG: O-acetylhomoserine aminocarboxypropyltransferase [Methylobacteriaceae bacterium]|jgi:O-acetylhomoserine (thiol)-lyase|nr:O-acetylhomoserine aminocarboxypropyltransferase [Methylobacteriaceae bacterium]